MNFFLSFNGISILTHGCRNTCFMMLFKLGAVNGKVILQALSPFQICFGVSILSIKVFNVRQNCKFRVVPVGTIPMTRLS